MKKSKKTKKNILDDNAAYCKFHPYCLSMVSFFNAI